MRGLTVKLPALVPVPPGVVTLIGPVVAPAGTVAVILIDVFTCVGRGDSVERHGCRSREVGRPLMITLVPTARSWARSSKSRAPKAT